MAWQASARIENAVVGSAGRREALGKLVRVGPALTLAAVAGFALGACGGGGSLGTRTGASATRSVGSATRTLPTRTVTTSETATTEVTTTVPGPTTTREHVRATTATQTTVVPVPVTTAPTSAETSSSSTPWGWIILGVALAAALLIGLLLWRRHRAGAEEWGAQTADLNRRALVALDDVLAKGSVVTGQIEALAAEAHSLEARAPDDPSRAAAARVRARLDELATTLEADRTLRLGSPPPSPDQLDYSTALIRQQAEQLQGALRFPGTGPPGTTSWAGQ